MITLNRSDLLAAFAVLGGAVQRRSGIAALKHVLVQTPGPDAVTLRATDLDLHVTAEIGGHDLPRFAALYPWDALHSLVQSLPDGSQIEFARTEQRVSVRSGRFGARFGILDPQEFPPAPNHATATTFEIEAETLSTLLSTAIPFTAKEDLDRLALKGIALRPNPAAYALEAIGGSTQAVVLLQAPLPEGAETMPAIVLPTSAVGVFLSAVKDRPGPVTLAIGEAMARLTVAGISVSTKLVSDGYPDFFARMPQEWPRQITVDRAALESALDRLLPLSDQDAIGLRAVVFTVAAGTLSLSIKGLGAADAEETLDCIAEPAEMRFGLNGARVRQLLGTVATDRVTMRGIEPTPDGAQPFRFDPVGVDDGAIRMTASVRV